MPHIDAYLKAEDLKPENCLANAQEAINNDNWPRATAFATMGLLSLAIGAAKGLVKLQPPQDT